MKTLSTVQKAPLSQQLTQILLNMLIAESNGDGPIEAIRETTSYKLIKTKLVQEVSEQLIVFLACLCVTPADAAMWAMTLDVESIMNLRDWCKVFADGIPTREAYNSLWERIKYEKRKSEVSFSVTVPKSPDTNVRNSGSVSY